MLSSEELQQLLLDIESDRVEWTIATKDIDKFSKAICAFANDMPDHKKPGYLIIGAKDKGGLHGLQVTDELIKDLSSIRSNGRIQPLPSMTVAKYSFPNQKGDVAVVEVMPSLMPPVRFEGKVWIRIGSSKQIATEQEERILTERRIAKTLTFDARPCLGSNIQELSLELFMATYLPNAIARDILERNNRNASEQMASLRLFDASQKCPTNAGILLLGQDPLRWLPGAYIQFVRFSGTELSDKAIDEQQFSGDLITVLHSLDSFIPRQIQQYPEYKSPFRERAVFDYPVIAIRELLMNAIMHRNYEGSTSPIRFYWFDDRIEIQNPGGLFGEVTAENYMRQTAYRNPVLAEAMKNLGYINRFGAGIGISQKELKENGNPPAEFTFESNSVLVILRKRL
ncbi:MAG: ATP-binding protein [Candidatus Omnitrophota bacterium]